MSKRLLSYVYLLINTVCWGAALVVVKPALDFTSPFRFLLYRYAVAAVLSSGFIWWYWPKITRKLHALHTITRLELIGLTLTLGLLYTGLNLTTATEANLIGTTTPIFITLAGILFLRERQEKHEWLGLGLALGGTLLLTLLPIWHQLFIGQNLSLTGNLLVLGQNITTAAYFVLAKKYYKNWPALFVAGVSFWVGLASFFLLSLHEQAWHLPGLWQLIQQDWQQPSVQWASVYMAVFGSIIGLTAYIQGQKYIEASEASVFWYLQPLVYLPLGVWLLHERVGFGEIFALGVILAGVWITEGFRARTRRNKTR
jgi:drug/metabolite transporter (DMT)-like permease